MDRTTRAQLGATPAAGAARNPWGRRAGRAGAGLVAAALLVPVTALPSSAAVTQVELPANISMFPERDFINITGFPLQPVTINVYRGDVKIGSATGTPDPDAVDGSILEVNHPGGVCWTGSTPDLLTGDRVEVVMNNEQDAAGAPVGQFATMEGISAEPATVAALDPDGIKNDLVVHGKATNLVTGGRIDEDRIEQRIIQPAMRDADPNFRRDLRALFGAVAPDAAITWDNPTNPTDTSWTAIHKNLPTYFDAATGLEREMADLAAAGQTRGMAWNDTTTAGDRVGMTLFEAGELGGPGMGGCPAAAVDAVTGTLPANINQATSGQASLVVNGVAHNAATVKVTVDDHDGVTTDAITVDGVLSNPADTVAPFDALPGNQTFRASVPMSQVLANLGDGELLVTAEYGRTSPTRTELQDTDGDAATAPVAVEVRDVRSIGGAEHTLLKDLVAPAAPSPNLPGGTYTGAQSILLSPEDEVEDTVRYRIGADAATTPSPTAASPVASGPLSVTSTQSIKYRSYDRAGNFSPVVTSTYTIVTASVPSRMAAPTAVADDASATVNWTAPTNTGGSAITNYVIKGYIGSGTSVAVEEVVDVVAGAPLSARVTGLTNGLGYRFSITAWNATGESLPSARSVEVVPQVRATAPSAPTIGTATGLTGGTSANVTWTPPSSNGGSAITSYTVRAFGGPTVLTQTAAPGATSLVFAGLARGTTYTFNVSAVNAVGTSVASGTSNSVTMPPAATVPGAPTGVTAIRGNASATVRWTAPASNGGSAITGYSVRAYAGTSTTPITRAAGATAGSGFAFTGLTNGVSYTFDVQAVNAVGTGAPSARSAAVVPATAPGAPTIGGISSGVAGGTVTATANWAAPTNVGGSAITGYRVTARRYTTSAGTTLTAGAAPVVSAVLPATSRQLVMSTGLVNGAFYRFTVVAINAAGTSASSAASAVATAR